MTNDRTLAYDEVDEQGVRVSTVRLTIDHGFGGTPLWYETMVFPFDSWTEEYCMRYATPEQALAGHAAILETIRRAGVAALDD